jgi:hypothetical protein
VKSGFLAWNFQLSNFTILNVSLNPTIGSDWNFIWGIRTYFFTFGYRKVSKIKTQCRVSAINWNLGGISCGIIVIDP